MSPRILCWVQSRMGLGHLARTMNLAGALAADGFEVVLAHGGPHVPAFRVPSGVTFAQLPVALSPDLSSSEIMDAQGRPIDETWKAARIGALKSLIERSRPDIVMTETFPLGRRLFSFELTPILAWLRQLPSRPIQVCSVRDIVTRPVKSSKAEAMVDLALQEYDAVLCHADPQFARLTDGFPETARLAHMTRYTGYVVDTPPQRRVAKNGVIVVAGGGAAGGDLFKTALSARKLWPGNEDRWRIVTGPRFRDAELTALRQEAPEGIEILGAVEGLAQLYANASLVVAQAGYNTVCEVLSQGTKLAVVPYATAKETEQTIRAKLFSKLGLLTMVEPDRLSPETLVQAMHSALALAPPAVSPNFHGGPETARILKGILSDRRT